MEIVEGTLIATHGPLVTVQVGDRTMVVASRRRLNWEGGTPSAPRLVVGDRVSVEMKGDDGVIVAVHARSSCLVRRAPGGAKAQVLAANVDQALLVFSAGKPKAKRGLLDRFLVACELAEITPVIAINKVDQGADEVEEWLPVYEVIGYEVLRVSARTGWGLGRVRRRLADRTTLFCGPSGAGKSSLLNAVYPGFRLKVGSISEATGKGRHTTVVRELFLLDAGGYVADTPGLKALALWDIEPEEVDGYFPELRELVSECQFSNCTHIHEPGCAVMQAVEDQRVHFDRYDSYVRMRLGEEEAQADLY